MERTLLSAEPAQFHPEDKAYSNLMIEVGSLPQA